jgi:hypothetical protein
MWGKKTLNIEHFPFGETLYLLKLIMKRGLYFQHLDQIHRVLYVPSSGEMVKYNNLFTILSHPSLLYPVPFYSHFLPFP